MDFFEISELSVVMCRTPGAPAHGIVEGDDFKYGAQVYFKCNAGYSLKGSRVAYCQLDGIWSTHHPECGKVTLSFGSYQMFQTLYSHETRISKSHLKFGRSMA